LVKLSNAVSAGIVREIAGIEKSRRSFSASITRGKSVPGRLPLKNSSPPFFERRRIAFVETLVVNADNECCQPLFKFTQRHHGSFFLNRNFLLSANWKKSPGILNLPKVRHV